ncbi:hypothetical protein HK104_000537 [Borealophlyctis nickersoniae]|nr:hypothetical protein HK104_000537 [Borealophlyctis nickersoniae]
MVLDRHASFANETSSRNSEVIHAGIYYPHDSLKTRLCIRGKRLLYDLCERHNIPHRRMGKWIVAVDSSQEEYLHKMKERADSLGVPVEFLSGEKARQTEPNVNAKTVLVSPTTGIIDSHTYMQVLENKITEQGGDLIYRTAVTAISPASSPTSGYIVQTPDATIHTRTLVNSAGLAADRIAAMLLPPHMLSHLRIKPCKGRYYSLRQRSSKPPVSRLIYPVPEANLQGLGVHCTLDMAGKVKFGPDTVYTDRVDDYSIEEDPELLDRFHRAIVKYMPGTRKEDLYPDYAGVRPKLSGPGEPFRDFVIEIPEGFPNFVNLVGIESPGLTASPAIAELVNKTVGYQ